MNSRCFVYSFLILSILSCSREANDVILYSNSYEDNGALADYEINTGQIGTTKEESAENSKGCLNIFGWCGTPNLFKELGPFEEDYTVYMEAWIKTQYGAAIHLNRKKKTQEYVRLESKEDVVKGRNWHYYTSDKLFVPQGSSLMLYIDASNNTQGHTWIDELKIYGEPN